MTTPEVAGTVAEDAATAVAPDAVTHTQCSHTVVDTDSLTDVRGLLNRVLGAVEHPPETTPDESSDAGNPVEPGDGGTVRDKSPASQPWTHKRLGR